VDRGSYFVGDRKRCLGGLVFDDFDLEGKASVLYSLLNRVFITEAS
jgi:hypothetical protein